MPSQLAPWDVASVTAGWFAITARLIYHARPPRLQLGLGLVAERIDELSEFAVRHRE